MINPFKEVNWNPDTAARRTFARSLIIGFPAVALVFLLVGKLTHGVWNTAAALKLAGFGAGAGVLFYALPAIAWPFYVVWYALACCVGLVMGNVLIALLFYVMVTGIGLLKRAFGAQPIAKRPDPQAKTYWLDARPVQDVKSYYRQF